MVKKAQEVFYTCVALAKSIGGRCRHHEDGKGTPRYCSTHRNGDAESVPLADRYLLRFELNLKWEEAVRMSGMPFVEDMEGQTLRNVRHERRADQLGRDFQKYCGSGEELQGGNGSLVFDPFLPATDFNTLYRQLQGELVLVNLDVKYRKKHGEVGGFTVTFAFEPDEGEGQVHRLSREEEGFLRMLLSKTWAKVYVYDNPPNGVGERKVSVNFTGPSDQAPKNILLFAQGLFDSEEIKKKQDSAAA